MANKQLKSIKFPNLSDTYTIPQTAEDLTYNESETYSEGTVGKAIKDTKEIIVEDYAEIDGSYESMTVGNAEQLVSNVRVNDKTPYIFRTSGGSVDIGDREYVNGIIGGTVAWNQLVQNGNFASDTGWSTNGGTKSVANNVLTLTSTVANNVGIYQSVSTINGHKYLLSGDMKITTSVSSVAMRWVLSDGGSGNDKSAGTISSGVKTNSSVIVSPTSNWSRLYILSPYSGSGMAVGDKIEFSNFMCIDLTQMFGSTIADYVYSLEQNTAGAGVAWFKKLFNKPYYAYNAGELKSVSGLVSHDMTGFNQFDKTAITANTWLSDVDGTTATQNGYNVSDFIPILPNTTYYKSNNGSGRNLYYDADKAVLPNQAWGTIGDGPQSFTTPANAHFVRFTVTNAYLDSFVFNLSWDGSRNGEYEPYELHSYPLDSDLTLRGIPKLDANNNLYYDGDEYAPDGTVTRKYGAVALGALEWAMLSGSRFYAQLTNLNAKASANNDSVANIVMANYTATSQNALASNMVNKTMCLDSSTSPWLNIVDTTYSTALAFKTAMSDAVLVYELATPTTETADPYQQTQIVNDFGTEEYVISDNTFAVPVGNNTDYPENLRKKIEELPWDFSTLIAPTEITYKATRNYTTGSLLIVNNILYKVTANIGNGGTITPNTNVIATTLAEVISAL